MSDYIQITNSNRAIQKNITFVLILLFFKVVYIAPLKALVRERMNDWRIRLEKKLGKKVVELTGKNLFVTSALHVLANLG